MAYNLELLLKVVLRGLVKCLMIAHFLRREILKFIQNSIGSPTHPCVEF